MGRRKKTVLAASVTAGVLVLVLIIGAIYKYVAPSNVKRELSTVFGLGENEVALIVDNVQQEEKGLRVDGQTYVPASVPSSYMDERIYVDAKEKILSYATVDGLIQVRPGDVSYTLAREEKKVEAPILSEHGDALYVSLDFIAGHASCYYKEYEGPSRLIIMSDRTRNYTLPRWARTPACARDRIKSTITSPRCRREAGLLPTTQNNRKTATWR